MIKFTNEPESWKRLDYKIISRGFVKPYNDCQVLKKDIDWLISESYKVITFDCSEWTDKETMHNSLHNKFDFPVYYGNNWDALEECLNEIVIQDNGLVVLFDNFDTLDFKMSHTLIDVFVSSAQRHLIFVQRFLILIRVQNNNFKLTPYVAFNLYWY